VGLAVGARERERDDETGGSPTTTTTTTTTTTLEIPMLTSPLISWSHHHFPTAI